MRAALLISIAAACSEPDPVVIPDPGRVLAGPLLGRGLAIEGQRLWVTAPGVDGQGGVYGFDALAGDATLDAADASVMGSASGTVGDAVAVCPDLNGDGVSDLVVGAPLEGTYGGAWLVHGPHDGETSLGEQPFAAGIREDGNAGSALGCGDADGDGRSELAVSAPDTDGFGMAIAAGTIGIHRQTGEAVDRIGNLDTTWSDSHLGYRSAVALGADLDGDGVGDLVVGGWGADRVHVVFGPLAGSYDSNTAGPTLQGPDREGTGHAIAVGDITGDGAADLVIGAPLAGFETGAVWVMTGPFDDDSSGLMVNVGHRTEGVQPGDQAGFSVAVPGDVDRDGSDDILVGAPFAGGVGSQAGAAYLLLDPLGTTDMDLADALLLGDVSLGRLGWSVAGADLDGDGAIDLVVGAPEVDVGSALGVGVVFVYPASVRGTQYPDAASARIDR